METLTLNAFKFEELEQSVKDNLIKKRIESNYNTVDAYWIIDDCYLLQPMDLGNEDILIKNLRKGVYFSTDYRYYLRIADGAEIVDDERFKEYFKIPSEYNFYLHNPRGQYDSTVLIILDEFGIETELPETEELWSSYIGDVLSRIEQQYDYYFGEEYAEEELINDDELYLTDGTIINI
jgi:hypothetical protein